MVIPTLSAAWLTWHWRMVRFSPATLDLVIGPKATDAVWQAARHLLRIDRDNNWSVFHNSFRLFLRAQTTMRHGQPDREQVRQRYVDLAEIAVKADVRDEQRWMELRYRARATEHDKVAALATAERFRKQFVEGRNPEIFYEDISLSFQTAKALRNSHLVFDLILGEPRTVNHGTRLLEMMSREAVYRLGDLRTARGVLQGRRCEPYARQRIRSCGRIAREW